MDMNATREGNIFSFDCPACGTRNSTDVTEYDPQFLEEIGTYENLSVTCTNCMVQIGFNMALPLFEIAEPPGYFDYATDDDMNTREILRTIMWERMPDLREKDREIEEEIYRKENKLDEYPIATPGNTQQPTTPTQPTPPPDPDPLPVPEEDQEPEAQLPAEDPPVDAAPPEEDQETGSDREEVVQEIRDAIEEAIQTEEGANNND